MRLNQRLEQDVPNDGDNRGASCKSRVGQTNQQVLNQTK